MKTDRDDFVQAVIKMRECQKSYFKTHMPDILRAALKAEKTVDDMLADSLKKEKEASRTKLFEEDELANHESTLCEWQRELNSIRIRFGETLRQTDRLNIKSLEWSTKEGCVDVLFNNGGRRSICVIGDSEQAFMQDILMRI